MAYYNVSKYTSADITYPGILQWHQENIGYGTQNPYSGNLILLFDEKTYSQAEYTCMALEPFDETFKIGSTTAGAFGNVSGIALPGSITTYGTFIGIHYPDNTPTQRVGIIPDFEVNPTISGTKDGRDEQMDFALSCDFVDIEEISAVSNIKLYPNPVIKTMNYELVEINNNNIIQIEVTDIYNRTIIKSETHNSQGTIDLSSLNEGIYIFKVKYDRMVSCRTFIKY